MKKYLSVFSLITLFTVLSMAQLNFELAINEANSGEKGDMEVMKTMHKYGFYHIEDGYCLKTTSLQKIKAIFTNKKN